LGDLRLILAAICLVLLGGIWWWSARGSRQARGAAELRERGTPAGSGTSADESADLPDADVPRMRADPEPQRWGVPPFEPLSIKTADFDGVPLLDLEISADPTASARAPASTPVQPGAAPVKPGAAPVVATPATLSEPSRGAARAPVANDRGANDRVANDRFAADRQKIFTVRVAAHGTGPWPGNRLVAALDAQGLVFGRYQVYHRKHVDGRSLFCVASLVEPGTFDPERMPQDEFRGISLFAVLPGPLEAVPTVDALLATARGLADDLGGAVQDEKGLAMSPLRIAELRSEAGRFQASAP